MAKLEIINNPLIKTKLTLIRDKRTTSKDFYSNLTDIAMLMSPFVFKDINLEEVKVVTPICETAGYEVKDKILLVVILRAGLGFLEGFRKMIPEAKIGFLGMYRDEETLLPHEYYKRLPKDLSNYKIYILDPMLATGGSAVDACNSLVKYGAKDISFVGLVGAPEGIEKLNKEYPQVNIYLASLDEKLNESGYIVPGLGDCGDRVFGM